MSSIEWTDRTWNPIVGCSRVSPGCENCYAERQVHRKLSKHHVGLTVLRKSGVGWTGKVRLVESALGKPLSWRKPRRIFVNSLSDLFHENLSDDDIETVFAVMHIAAHHTFQILTKRPERAREFLRKTPGWPLPNVWLGVTAEDQQRADERIPVLLDTPAAKRFVSYEPALGPVDFGMSNATCDCCPRWSSRWVRLHGHVAADYPLGHERWSIADPGLHRAVSNRHGALSVETRDGKAIGIKPAEFSSLPALDWVIVGGESGHGARPFELAWARSTVEQCRAAGVACFVKQLGRMPVTTEPGAGRAGATLVTIHNNIAHRKGADPSEWPEDLRVREFPL